MPVMRARSSALGTLVVLWFGGRQVIARRSSSLGDLVAFIGYLHLLAWPTMALGWMLSIVQRGRAAMQRLEEIFAIEPAIADRRRAAPDRRASPTPVRRRRVEPARATSPVRAIRRGESTHGRPGASNALVDFDVRPPARRSRSSAAPAPARRLAACTCCRASSTSPAARCASTAATCATLPLATLRRAIGFVPQDPFLFSRRIRDNIAFARRPRGATTARVAARPRRWPALGGRHRGASRAATTPSSASAASRSRAARSSA